MSRDAVTDLVHSYADAVVHRNGDQWAATWARDARWVLTMNRDITGREAILALWHRAMGGFEAVVQNVLNGTAAIDEVAGTGTGRWYIHEHFRRVGGEVGILLAHYDDTYVIDGGRWCFASRMLVPHYQGPPDLSGTFLNAVT
jgi:hypothetical protein